jgi:hypothetical protein
MNDENDALGMNQGRRKGSDSSPLRPVLSFGPELLNDDNEDDGSSKSAEEMLLGNNAIMEDELQNEEEEDIPKPKAGGIDEVEHIWNL